MLTALVAGTLSVAATWLAVGVAFIGVGLIIRRVVYDGPLDVSQCFTSFWVGFGMVILFLQIWHLAFAVSWQPLAITMAAGFFGLVWNRTPLSAWLRRFEPRPNATVIGALVLCALWVGNSALAAGDEWDYGVYHLPALLWTKTYPLVPGLGNLHGRLALNSSYHLYGAMLDVGWWSGKSNHLANGLLITALLFQIVVAAFRSVRRHARREHRYALELGLLAPTLFLVLRRNSFASVMTDVPVAVILFVAAAMLFELVAGPERDAGAESFDVVTLLTLLTVAICIKLTAAGFAIPAALLTLSVWIRRNRYRRPLMVRTLSLSCAVVGVLGGFWVARGVILSGYPAYPSTVFPAPVAWRVPEAQARAEMAWIRHYARWYYNPPVQSRGWIRSLDGQRSYDPARFDLGWSWFPGWLSNLWRDREHREGFVLPALIAVLAALTLLGARRVGSTSGLSTLNKDQIAERGAWMARRDDREYREYVREEQRRQPGCPAREVVLDQRGQATSRAIDRGWLVLAPAIVGLAWWFFTAPTPRFGFFLVWICAATVLTQALRSFYGREILRSSTPALLVTLALGSAPVVNRLLPGSVPTNAISPAATLHPLIVVPSDDQWFLPSPTAAIRDFTTDSGLTVHVPTSDQRCWDAPLPCTPQPAENLALRRRDELRSGFINTDGQWRQQDFPDPRTYNGPALVVPHLP